MARILIVEDDKDTGEALSLLLEHAGHHTETAPSGHEALGTIMNHKPDLVVLDLSMPGMDGTDVLDVIRSYMRLQSLPVVIWTGMAEGDLVAKAWELKVASVVPKGQSNFNNILAAVELALPKKTAN
jgi:CheY-like chemotaxis protein